MAFHRRFAPGLDGRWQARFQNVQPHHIAIGIVKHERQEIEVHDTVKPLRKVVKKSREVAMLRDRFRHFEQSFELAPGMFEWRSRRKFGRGDSGIRHRKQNSTQLGRGSTEGVTAKQMNLRPSVPTMICSAWGSNIFSARLKRFRKADHYPSSRRVRPEDLQLAGTYAFNALYDPACENK